MCCKDGPDEWSRSPGQLHMLGLVLRCLQILVVVTVQSMSWHELFRLQSHMMSHLCAAALSSMIFQYFSIFIYQSTCP